MEQDVAVKLENHERRLVSAEHRVRDLETTQKQINELTISVKEIAMSIKQMTEEQKRQGERLSDLEQKPAKRWDLIITTIITCIISSGLGFIIAHIV